MHNCRRLCANQIAESGLDFPQSKSLTLGESVFSESLYSVIQFHVAVAAVPEKRLDGQNLSVVTSLPEDLEFTRIQKRIHHFARVGGQVALGGERGDKFMSKNVYTNSSEVPA